MPKETSAFRVIVVGAGVAGLTASHCFQKSGIDHVVLERRSEIDPPEGASIAIYPHGARILQQIGCLDAAQEKCKPCVHFNSRWPDGKLLFDDPFFDHVRKNHGQDILLFERRRYLRILYDGLPDKSRIRMGATVKDVKQTVDGVEVLLSDGSVEKGDIVLGCDGVYSRVRNFMWDHADAVSPGRVTGEEKAAMKTRWKCLVGTGPPEPGLGERDMTVVHDRGFSFLALTQPNRSFWFVFFRLDSPFAWPQRANYTEQDAEELAATVADHHVSDTLVFGQLWKKRDRGMLIPLEEGVLKHWFSGRVVLAGDAAHKVTPNIALGGNSAMESVVVLCNQISRMMEENGGIKPDQGTLERHLKAYQDEQRNRVWFIMKFSGLITSIQAWDSPFTKFLAVWVLPLLPNRFLALSLGLIIRTAPRLEAAGNSGVETWRNKVESTVKNRFDILRTRKVVGAFIVIFLVLCLSLRR
ncbi:FAD binding domain protein [Hypoxylon rubiginosum]|uniref:FAD binding domain protein n=1 Tax=Hypoxylon rubiginosum TaxID=110542 RepID=A0ACC0D4T2_9PEZI|nr:FAD binding domain protein [Hypoxylon rubiginosum]